MRAKVNERTNMSIAESINESHVNSVIAMAIDYATSFMVFRHETSTDIDVFWMSDRGCESYSIDVMHSGAVLVYDTSKGFDSKACEEYSSYEDAFERLVDIFTGMDS